MGLYIPGPLSLPMDTSPVRGRVMTLPSPVAGPGPSSAPWYPGRVGGGADIGLLFVKPGVFGLLLSLSLALLGNVGAWPGRFVRGVSGVLGSFLSALGSFLSALGGDLVLPVQDCDCLLHRGDGVLDLEAVKQVREVGVGECVPRGRFEHLLGLYGGYNV